MTATRLRSADATRLRPADPVIVVPPGRPTGLRPVPLRPPGRAPDVVALSELGPDQTDVLDAVFAGLSAASRYLRFHAATPRMTAGVRRRLADVDGHRHLAVAAFDPAGRPVGIARLVALDDHRAELAIEVADAWQGRGVGARLLRAVAGRGREEGYTRLVADVLTENTGMRVLLASVLPILSTETDGHEITLTADLGVAGPVRVMGPVPVVTPAA
ncbi:GNAT family N-acetyltransferase [Actinomycetospora endophytica]|uniref:GNAT family N-acetyltransferase n=1 Tax=Actinomycetospora endophytica TaxID=2291215 RepID=A0ABS8P7C6_9PSEU|nr:GNAT family N-acetyltransferase [Actinomycetospora endophytica]MCD2194138.1 GNAT family N-acetyltransferase [Actinomycetospora endophytica]